MISYSLNSTTKDRIHLKDLWLFNKREMSKNGLRGDCKGMNGVINGKRVTERDGGQHRESERPSVRKPEQRSIETDSNDVGSVSVNKHLSEHRFQ